MFTPARLAPSDITRPSLSMTATYDTGSGERANDLASFNGTNATNDANGNLTLDPSNNGTYTWNKGN